MRDPRMGVSVALAAYGICGTTNGIQDRRKSVEWFQRQGDSLRMIQDASKRDGDGRNWIEQASRFVNHCRNLIVSHLVHERRDVSGDV